MKDLLTRIDDLLADVRDTLAAIEANRKERRVTWCRCGCVTLGEVQCPACERKGTGTTDYADGHGSKNAERGSRNLNRS